MFNCCNYTDIYYSNLFKKVIEVSKITNLVKDINKIQEEINMICINLGSVSGTLESNHIALTQIISNTNEGDSCLVMIEKSLDSVNQVSNSLKEVNTALKDYSNFIMNK